MRTFLKKVTVLFITGSVLVLSGFGCSQNTQSVPQPITLEFWTVQDDVDALEDIVNQYRATHPYLTINIRQLKEDEIYNRFTESLAEDHGPDIISVSNRQLGKYLSKLSPMPSAVQDINVTVTKGQFGGENTSVSSQVRSLLTADQLDRTFVEVVKNDAVRNGKVYGQPLSLDVLGIYYNKDLLNRAGIPQPPSTWQEFQEQAKLLTKIDKVSNKILQAGAALGTGKNVPYSSDVLFILFAQSNAASGNTPFVNKNGQAIFNYRPNSSGSLESPAGGVMNFYTDFANPAKDTYSWNSEMPNALDSFANGSLAFFFGYSYDYAVIKTRNPQLNFDVMPMLQLSEEKPVTCANYWLETVPAKSKHKNEAWAFIDYLTRSAAVKQYLAATKRPAAVRSLINDQKNDPVLGPFMSQILVADSWYHGKDPDAADAAIDDMFTQWLEPGHDEQFYQWHQKVLDTGASRVNQTM